MPAFLRVLDDCHSIMITYLQPEGDQNGKNAKVQIAPCGHTMYRGGKGKEQDMYSRELSDVQDLQGINIEIGDFLTFADFFFDGFLADIMVQSKIRKAQDDIDNAIYRVESLLGRLKNL